MAIGNFDLVELFQQALRDDWGYIWGTSGEEWTEAKQRALEKTTDSDRAQGRQYGSRWIGHMVADCSGLFTWAFRKLGGTMYHGSDTMYRKWCAAKGELKKGKRTDGKALVPGTAVFVWNGAKYSHVGLFVGSGLVIEAASTKQGVITSKVTASKWAYWGELNGVEYSRVGEMQTEVQTIDDRMPVLKRGCKGAYVKKLQMLLDGRGYDLGPCGVDGDFGRATEAAVKALQKDCGLKADGICGPATWGVLLVEPPSYYNVEIPHLLKSQVDEIKAKYPNVTVKECD